MLNPLDRTVRFLDSCVIPAFLSRFFRARRGAVMIYVAALLPAFFGIAMLTVDGARLFNLQSLLQHGADALALVGANELDGKARSIIRSNNAIANLVSNSSKFGAGGTNISVTQRYLFALPLLDSEDVETGCSGGTCVTVDPALAKYVEIKVSPASGSFNTIFPASLFGVSNVLNTSASAIAGFNLVVCEFTPIFICNPFEGIDGVDILDAIGPIEPAPTIRRRLINMRQQGGGGQYSPGNYGFLEPIDSNPGADALRDMIGMSNPPACFAQNGVTTRPGFVATVRDAVNVRFDMYNGPMNSNRNNPQFRPARNVRKGWEPTGGAPCNITEVDQTDPAAQSLKLPRDNCFPDSCTHMGGRMGNGEWDFDTYWTTNYGHHGRLPPVDENGVHYSNGNLTSRYEIYRAELTTDTGVPAPVELSSQGNEVGEKTCSDSAVDDDPDRRTIFGVVLNCVAEAIDGGRAGPYPVHAFVKFFITEPVEASGGDQDIYAEIVNVFEPGADGGDVVRDDVQLYR